MEFFLLRRGGGGFTDVGVRALTYAELLRRVKRLDKELKLEAEAAEKLSKEIRAKRQSRRR